MSSQHRITPRTRAGHWPSLALEDGHTPLQGAPWAPGVREQAPVCLVAEGGVPHRLPGGRARPCVCGCRLPQMGVWGTPRPHPEPALATSRRGRGHRAPTTGSPCHLTLAISYTLQSRIELSTEIRSALARTLLCERTRPPLRPSAAAAPKGPFPLTPTSALAPGRPATPAGLLITNAAAAAASPHPASACRAPLLLQPPPAPAPGGRPTATRLPWLPLPVVSPLHTERERRCDHLPPVPPG